MKAPQVGGGPGVNQLLPWLGAGTGSALGAYAHGIPGAAAGSMAGMLATQAVPPIARSILLSPPYQAMLRPPSAGMPTSQALAEALARYPALARIAAPAAALAAVQ